MAELCGFLSNSPWTASFLAVLLAIVVCYVWDRYLFYKAQAAYYQIEREKLQADARAKLDTQLEAVNDAERDREHAHGAAGSRCRCSKTC